MRIKQFAKAAILAALLAAALATPLSPARAAQPRASSTLTV